MTRRIDRHATRVARRLHHDRDLQHRFRQAPERVLGDAGLDDTQVEAVMSGNARDLAAAGIDPARVQQPPLRNRVRARILTVVSAVLALLGGPLLAAPASAARARFARFGARRIRTGVRYIRIGEFSGRYFGRFYVRQARRIAGLPSQGPCLKQCIGVEVLD